MKATRRVGSLTLGISLLVYGVLFLIHLFLPTLSYEWMFRLWPCIFILLGLEVLASYFINNQEKMKYDFMAVFLMFLMTGFAFGMGMCDYIIQHRGYL